MSTPARHRESRVAPGGPPPLVERLYAAYIRRPNHPMKLRLERVFQRLLGIRHVHASSPAGVAYRLFADDYVQQCILRHGVYEPATLSLVQRLLKPGDTMVDVGAHVGQYALHAAGVVGGAGRVVAVEPNPRTYQHLRENVALNEAENVLTVLGAVSPAASVLSMILPAEGNWGGHRVAPAGDASPSCALRVFGLPLAQILDQLGVDRVDLLKIDVEGFELQVLRSLDLSSPLRPRHIVVEFVPELASAQMSRPSELLAYLESSRYRLRTVEGDLYRAGATLTEQNLWAEDVDRAEASGPRGVAHGEAPRAS